MKSKRIYSVLLCLLFVLMLPVSVFARERVDLEKTGSISVTYPESGISFYLYRVGDMQENSEISLSGDFAEYPVSLEQIDVEGWNNAANTLAAYAQRDKIEPLLVISTNEEGEVVFSDLEVGIYLVTWEKHTNKERYTYTPQPFLVSLPSIGEEENWNYHVTVNAKFEKEYEPVLTDVRVHKAWDDASNTSKRPSEIQVQLLKDGQIEETVTLNSNNSWSYEWKDLDAKYNWQVTEKSVPKGYEVKINKEGITYLITNTFKPVTPTPTPGNPTPTPGTPSNPPKLPYTGMLWWPVPILAGFGLAAVIIGFVLKKKSEKK